jgi:hypothetical protein
MTRLRALRSTGKLQIFNGRSGAGALNDNMGELPDEGQRTTIGGIPPTPLTKGGEGGIWFLRRGG